MIWTSHICRNRRDGAENLYINANQQDRLKNCQQQTTQPPTQLKHTIPKVPCPICNKEYAKGAGIANQIKTHRNQKN